MRLCADFHARPSKEYLIFFCFLWTASEYTFPLFNNSVFKMVKTRPHETLSEVDEIYDLELCTY